MKRRTFLSTAARTAVMASWPAWLASAFAAESAKADSAADLAVLSEGYRRAQRAGKPLLVLIIPANDGDKYFRGQVFGEYLNHGSPEQLAPLLLCEVVCATMALLRRLVPTAGDGEPLMVLVETDRVPAEVQHLSETLTARKHRREVSEVDLDAELPPKKKEKEEERWRRRYEAGQRLENKAVDARIDQLAQLVHGAVMPSLKVLTQRQEQQRTHAPAEFLSSVDAKLQKAQDGLITPAELELAAAQIALCAQSAPLARKKSLWTMLGIAAGQKLQKSRIPGSKWAVSGGCGTRIEGEKQNLMVACGMGHVPAKSSRFLFFFTKRDVE